ncbi:uncharacterized protein [Branchiostoma lanceolatum]|uniref:uncharacterized protein isoform X5 n=1 Tax=Branchiostoma lanceolatum TaxID=7740 RepID=UPI003456F3A1
MTSSDTEDTVGNFVEQKRDAMSRTDVSASEHTRFIEDGEGETENSEAIQERSSWVDGVNERNMEEGGSRVRVVPAQGKCVRCAQRCEKMFSICLTSYHPLPPAPTWSDRCMFAVRCPPHGRVAQTLTLVMMAVLGWAALWAITKDDALPGGNLFALTVLLVLCVIGGRLIQRIKLPPLLGMLIVGILLRNVPGIMVGSWIDPVWASSIRLVALTVILIRAGLGLDPVQLRRLSWTVLLLAFLPCVVEASTLAVVIHFLLDFPWLWGFMLGFVLAAVSPAVVVPSMLWLQEVGLGVDQGIPTLVIASGSVDDVIAITGFAVCLGITFTTERSPQSAGVDGVGNRPIDDLWKQDSWVCRFRGPGLSGHGFCGRLQVEDGQGGCRSHDVGPVGGGSTLSVRADRCRGGCIEDPTTDHRSWCGCHCDWFVGANGSVWCGCERGWLHMEGKTVCSHCLVTQGHSTGCYWVHCTGHCPRAYTSGHNQREIGDSAAHYCCSGHPHHSAPWFSSDQPDCASSTQKEYERGLGQRQCHRDEQHRGMCSGRRYRTTGSSC